MIMNQQSLAGLFSGFNTLFNKGMANITPQYLNVAMTVPSSSSDETYAWLGQMPGLREWIGAREIVNLRASSYNVKNKDYELTLNIPRNDVMDDKIGLYTNIVMSMGESARIHPDELIFELLAKGFHEKCYDKESFFSENHSLSETNKQSNMGKYKLDSLSYERAMATMMSIKGESGKSLKIVPDLLVVAPQNAAKGREILFSDTILGSTNINKNTCELLVVPELADYGEQWYLLATKRALRPLIFQEREKPHLVQKTLDSDDNVFMDNEFLYGITARHNAGYGLWQLAYGSTGEEVAKG